MKNFAALQFGRAIGLLYGWNALGAVAGALVGELLFVPAVGLWGTAIAAACFNLAAAGLALSLSRDVASTRRSRDAGMPAKRVARAPIARLLITCCATGALLLALEVVWFRFL